MPTATKTRPASAELAPLEAKRDELHAAARAARRKRADYDAETERLRTEYTQDRHEHPDQYHGVDFKPRPGTEAAEVGAAIRERMRTNPHTDEYEQARAEFNQADAAVQRFRRERIHDLIAEKYPQADGAIDTICRGFETVAEGCEQYAAALAEVRGILTATPGLIGVPDVLAFDPRTEEWARDAAEVLAGEFIRPGLTPMGDWRVNLHD